MALILISATLEDNQTERIIEITLSIALLTSRFLTYRSAKTKKNAPMVSAALTIKITLTTSRGVMAS